MLKDLRLVGEVITKDIPVKLVIRENVMVFALFGIITKYFKSKVNFKAK